MIEVWGMPFISFEAKRQGPLLSSPRDARRVAFYDVLIWNYGIESPHLTVLIQLKRNKLTGVFTVNDKTELSP